MLSLKRNGSPVAASPRNVVNSTACRYLCARVKRTKCRSLPCPCATCPAAACSKSGILSSIFLLRLDLVIARADQPQDGVNHKERQRSAQQQVHEQPYKIERRIEFAIARVGMRLVLHKALV